MLSMIHSRILSVIALVAVAACQPKVEEPVPGQLTPTGTTLVTVNGQQITQDMVDATLAQIPPQMREQLEQSGRLDQLQEQLVIGELLYREGLKRELHKKDSHKMALALSARNTLVDAVLDSVVEERTTPERIKKWYDDHAVQFAKPQANVRVMVLETMEQAVEVKALLDGGADFATLAQERSKDARTAPKGGELGWMSKSDLRGEMGEAIFAAEKGAVVGPLEPGPGGGGVIFKVDDKRDAVPMSEVEDQIRTSLQQEIVQEYIEEVKSGATIVEAGATGATVTVPDPAAPAGAAAPAPAAAAKGPEAGAH